MIKGLPSRVHDLMWQRREDDRRQWRIHHMQPSIDTTLPLSYIQMMTKQKFNKYQESRDREIDLENRRMLKVTATQHTCYTPPMHTCIYPLCMPFSAL